MMRVIGRGLIAQSLEPYRAGLHATAAFATGVAASTCIDEVQYQRELDALRAVIRDAIRNGERVVYFSGGGAVYSDWSRPAREDDQARPQTAYGRHQMTCEAMLAESGVRYVILRLPNVVGATANREQLLPSIVGQVLAGRVTVQSSAERDLIAADDFARVASAVLQRVDSGAIVNVAAGSSVAVDAIAASVMRELGLSAEVKYVAGGTRQCFSIERLKGILGGDPFERPYPLDGILARCVPQIAALLRDGQA